MTAADAGIIQPNELVGGFRSCEPQGASMCLMIVSLSTGMRKFNAVFRLNSQSDPLEFDPSVRFPIAVRYLLPSNCDSQD